MDAPPLNASDIEKGQSKLAVGSPSSTGTATSIHEGQISRRHGIQGYFRNLLDSELAESRGIHRVGPEERHEVSCMREAVCREDALS